MIISEQQQKTEDELWVEYKKTHDTKLRDHFIKQYAPLVKYVAGKLATNMPQSVDFDDLISFGVFGLIDAIEKFDPDKHVKFKTYAVTRIRGAIFDELRNLDWIPRSIRQKSREVEDAIAQLETRLGRSATDSEIARAMGISEDELAHILYKVSNTSVLSLNDVWYTKDENEKMSIADSIESPQSQNPDSVMEREEIKKVIVNAIQELPDNEKKVLVLYYYENLTLREIGKVLDVTESRVSQLHTKAILRLRGKLTHLKKGIL
ncbi:MAG TPA: RNA polymerase sigma factor WhiG [Spirochaetia bacterium]|nr:RNA polymerase sigma factor WhiG [Spirochaetales bacterium]HRS64987.1 RNA polymerase sigma factor WhiG [Spirochaetia bacterium]HPD79674.1 RNA polymerase sigma factor WhiG [Spirochaetales bacterium]HQG39483.1 RNA polymerase sigma factor WhiG [Spirochaetales bacterium]HQK34392.1 RNA polymerase sigma factor WhiG [Spirochaetales bacterium]